MADNFGLKIGLEGEKEFKNSLAEINQAFKVLGSEMKLVESEFDKNDKSVEALTARNEVLGKQITAQKEKIEVLRAALKNASDSFGENDKRTQAWQIQLNNAEAALNKMERELRRMFGESAIIYKAMYSGKTMIGMIDNDVRIKIEFANTKVSGKYDIVVANILADVLVPLTPVIVNQMKKGGIYITSGIIDDKEETVVNAVKAAGLEVLEVTYQGGWVSVTARKN